ncbi:outer membrane beta-barrel protein [Pseudoxanthobacter sp.]|uniref:outer membrane protein n=1 Tax=Pseudoxanthobacter sp. TaxID=1925742 RepID=UPI002FE253EE
MRLLPSSLRSLAAAAAVAATLLPAAAVAGTKGAAGAGALGEPPVLEHTADMLPAVQDDFGFYLRADAGLSFLSVNSVEARGPVAARWGGGQGESASAVTGGLGIGAGLRWSRWLRTDLTLDYAFPGEVKASQTCLSCGGRLGASAQIASLAMLANAYADLPSLGRFTPWVGAGAGIAHLSLSGGDISLAGTGIAQIASADAWNFAWQGSAGVAMKLTDAVSLDAGYRYMGLGNLSAGGAVPGRAQDVARQEVRIGLRYRLDQ